MLTLFKAGTESPKTRTLIKISQFLFKERGRGSWTCFSEIQKGEKKDFEVRVKHNPAYILSNKNGLHSSIHECS